MATYTITSHGQAWKFDDTDWSPEFIRAMVEQGLKIRLDRASASKTKKEGFTDEDRLAEVHKTYEGLKAGQLPTGGTRERLTPEEKALGDALRANGSKRPKGATIEQWLESATRTLAEKQGKQFDSGMTKKMQTFLEKSDTYKKALAKYKADAKPTTGLDQIDL